MNQTILRMYYEMQGKIILPKEAAGNNNIALAVTVASNFASIGFPMATEQIQALSRASENDIKEFYKDNYAMLRDVLGANRNPKPFYPNFPEECMDKSDAEYFIDQVIYCLSGLELSPAKYREEKKRFPFIGEPMRRILMTGSEEDLRKTFEMAVSSTIAYSRQQRKFMMEYVKANPEAMQVLLDNVTTKNRENAVATAMMVEELSENSQNTKNFLKRPADVLRYAAFKSVVKENETKAPDESKKRDPYTAIALRDDKEAMPLFSVGRKERTFIMDALADMCKYGPEQLAVNMKGHDEEWERLYKHIHISDRAWKDPKYDGVKQAISYVLGGKRFDSHGRRVEEAIKANDVETAVAEAALMPGDFMRRFDKLYRMAVQQKKESVVLNAMKEAAPKAGIATVAGVIGSIEQRDKDEVERYFKGKNGKVVKYTEKKLRKGFTKTQIEMAKAVAMEGLSVKFAGKPQMGKVYISESLKDVKIPADIRNDSSSIGALTSGSKMPIKDDWSMMRFFISWTNKPLEEMDRRVDIDLTAVLLDKDMNIVGFCGWNGEKVRKFNGELGYMYSGDVQDGGPSNGNGAAEYIDINMDVLRKNGIAYLIPQVSSYTGQYFSEQPHTCFGVMEREPGTFGKTFEPATVVNRFVLDAECRRATPYVIDIRNREILWMNEKAQENVASRGVDFTIRTLSAAKESKVMPLYPLVEANVIANGTKSLTPGEADMLFVRDADEMQELKKMWNIGQDDKFILSTNKEYITGFLMQDGPDGQKK